MTQYQLLPSLTQDEYNALKDDIARRGVQVPIEYDENGEILDGHHRAMICRELGIKDYPSIVRPGMTEDEKKEHVLMLNLARRNLTPEQRKQTVIRVKQETAWSNRRIAELFGVSHVTIMNDLRTGKYLPVELPDRIIGKDGKNRPARKPAVMNKNQKDAQRTFEALAGARIDELPSTVMDTKRVSRIAREQRADMARQEIPDEIITSDLQILHGDFRDLSSDLDRQSVDLIFTDPPYPKEYLPLWSDLAAIASRVLKPGKLLVAYSGQMYLPQVISALGEYLEYVWLGSLVLKGPHNNVQAVKIHNHSKPLLFFSNGKYTPADWFSDTWNSEGKTKEHHEWEQSVGAANYYIDALTNPGDVVLDPFLGGGTTAQAAVELERSFVGYDIDAAAIAASTRRLYAGRKI